METEYCISTQRSFLTSWCLRDFQKVFRNVWSSIILGGLWKKSTPSVTEDLISRHCFVISFSSEQLHIHSNRKVNQQEKPVYLIIHNTFFRAISLLLLIMIMPGRVNEKTLPLSGISSYFLNQHKNYLNITVNPEGIITTASQKWMNNTTASKLTIFG